MGNLVFQATLGGQVNLVGPNTASTFNINVPAIAGTLVTTGDTGTVTNTMLASSAYTAPGTIGSGTPNTGAFTTLTASTSMRSPIVGAGSGSNLSLQANATTLATLDTSGNLGLGVSPSSWRASQTAIQFGSTGGYAVLGAGYATNAMVQVGTNFYVNSSGNSIYASSNAASNYNQVNGTHAWYYAASGTQGNTISFIQAMTLDASGNLGIGSTSPSMRLSVQNTRSDTAGTGFLAYTDSGTGAKRGLRTNTGNAWCFDYYNGSAWAEQMQLDSSGNLLVGTTGTGLKTNRSMGFQVAGGCVQYISHSTSDASGDSYVEFGYNGTKIGSITQTGTTAVLYNTTSDQRLKENIQDADSASSLIDSLQVRKFDWKSDNSHQRYGFVAQELVTVVPEAVNQPSNPDDMMAVDYSKLVPMLVKEIQSLRQRVASLEA